MLPCSGGQTPSLNDCVVTKQTFGSVSCTYFRSNSIVFFQLCALAMKITVVSYREKGNWLKRSFQKVFSKLINLLMSLEIQISSSLLLTSANKQRTFFTSQVLFGFFFPVIIRESFGCGLYTSVAYTRVLTVFEFSAAILEKSLHVLLYYNSCALLVWQ